MGNFDSNPGCGLINTEGQLVMNSAERVAFIQSQTACMLAELEGMKALNFERQDKGFTLAYDEDAFAALPDKYGLGHNTVVAFLQEQ